MWSGKHYTEIIGKKATKSGIILTELKVAQCPFGGRGGGGGGGISFKMFW